jgi:hypothetical protein
VELFTEPWFAMEALRCPLPDALTQQWAEGDVADELALPPRNPFITTDFTLKAAAASDGGCTTGAAAAEAAGRGGGGAGGEAAAAAALPAWVLAGGGGRPAHLDCVLSAPPAMIVDEPGVCVCVCVSVCCVSTVGCRLSRRWLLVCVW